MKNLTEFLTNPIFNSLTKYPSIQTFHKMEKGILKDELTFPANESLEVYMTEKIDGSNIRFIIYNGDYLIGSRKEWIYAKGDRLISNEQVMYLKNYVEEVLKSYTFKKNILYCIYGEVHGTGIQSWRNYTLSSQSYGFRIFDIWSMEKKDIENLLISMKSKDEVSNWRENNNQPWWNMNEMTKFIINCCGLLEYAPFKLLCSIKRIPTDIEETYEFMRRFQHTDVNLDRTGKQNAKAEGIVIRTYDRSYIAKLRFEDYEKTFKKRK